MAPMWSGVRLAKVGVAEGLAASMELILAVVVCVSTGLSGRGRRRKSGLSRLFCSSAIFHQESSCSEWLIGPLARLRRRAQNPRSKRNGFRHFDWNLLHAVLGPN